MMKFLFFGLAYLLAVTQTRAQQVKDDPFLQEYHEPWPVGKSIVDVRSIAVDHDFTVWIATVSGVLIKKQGDTLWRPAFDHDLAGPAFAVIADDQGKVWMATWKGVFVADGESPRHITGTDGPISTLCTSAEGVYAAGPDGVWLLKGNSFEKMDYTVARSVRSIVSDGRKGIWMATDVGLYHCHGKTVNYFQQPGVLLSAYIKGVAIDDQQKLWAACLGGVTILNGGKKEKVLRPQEGCPSIYLNCVKRAPDGVMWVGTKVGVVRFMKDGTHSLRFTRRWLLDDHVNDVCL